jgi:hypothetical protein
MKQILQLSVWILLAAACAGDPAAAPPAGGDELPAEPEPRQLRSGDRSHPRRACRVPGGVVVVARRRTRERGRRTLSLPRLGWS